MSGERDTSVQDTYLQECKTKEAKVDIVTTNGAHVNCVIVDYDDTSVTVLGDDDQVNIRGKKCLLYKQAISTIIPR